MKKIILLLCCVFSLATISLTGQTVHEDDANMSLGIKNALYVDIEGADTKKAEKAWGEIMKEFGKVKKNRKAKEFYSEQVVIPAIAGSQPLDVFVRFDEKKNLTRAYLWVFDGDEFINSIDHDDESSGAESILKDLFVKSRRFVVEEEVKEEEKIAKNLDKDLNKLRDKNEDLHKDIEKWKREIKEREERIVQAEKDIESNLIDQDNKELEIDAQQEIVKQVIDKLNGISRY